MQAVVNNHPTTAIHKSIKRVHVTPANTVNPETEEIIGYAIVSGRKPAHLDGVKFASIMANYDWEARWVKQSAAMTPAEYVSSLQRDRGALAMAKPHAGSDSDLEALMLLEVSTAMFAEGVC